MQKIHNDQPVEIYVYKLFDRTYCYSVTVGVTVYYVNTIKEVKLITFDDISINIELIVHLDKTYKYSVCFKNICKYFNTIREVKFAVINILLYERKN